MWLTYIVLLYNDIVIRYHCSAAQLLLQRPWPQMTSPRGNTHIWDILALYSQRKCDVHLDSCQQSGARPLHKQYNTKQINVAQTDMTFKQSEQYCHTRTTNLYECTNFTELQVLKSNVKPNLLSAITSAVCATFI